MANLDSTGRRAVTVTATASVSEPLGELLAAFRDPDPDLDRIVQLIAGQPSLAAEVLRRSNSVVFAGGAPAVDVFEAVSRIGLYETYSIAVSWPPGSPISRRATTGYVTTPRLNPVASRPPVGR